MNGIKYWLRALSDSVLPRTCTVCGRVLGIRENHLCIYCADDFPFTFFWKQSHNPMSERLNTLICRSMEGNSGYDGYEPYANAAALFYYSSGSGYKEITRQLKYHGNIGIGLHYGKILGEKLSESGFLSDVDMIVPVPLHWARKWQRGYNQAEIIADGISISMGVPVNSGILYRNRRTESQTKLNIERKLNNVRSAFSINEKIAGEISPRHILLVDDVFTTGATIYSCHRALRRFFGPQVKIGAATLGFVGC